VRYTLDLCVATVNAKARTEKARTIAIDNRQPRAQNARSPHYLLIVRAFTVVFARPHVRQHLGV